MLGMSKYEYHGASETSEYSSWSMMKSRCNSKERSYYHGRGIKVCDRWANSFLNFLADMGKKPTLKHSIDRIDANGDYTPENCRWATKQQQSLNRRKFKNNKSGYIGVSWHKRDRWWEANIRNGELFYLGRYSTAEEAAYVRDQFALQLYGNDITLNFEY